MIFSSLPTPAPAQEADMASPVAPNIHPEEHDAELEVSPPPEVMPPLVASPAAAVEPELV